MARQICLGLQCAHQGIFVNGELCPIIHRDIKPSNILVIPDPSFGELVKILDFGIAKLIQSSDSAKTNCYLGTLTYSSPEQMEGQELDNRSDIYSLGVIMFEMLTGKIPLQANTESFGGWYKAHHFQPPRSFASVDPRLEVPEELENLVMKCLAKAPSDRFQNISEILQTLASLEQYLGQSIVNQASAPGVKSVEPPIIPREELTLSVDEVEQLPSWPKNKPLADILFPHPCSELVEQWLTEDFFKQLPPKSTGRELFGFEYLHRCLADVEPYHLSSADLLATLTELTVASIVKEYSTFLPHLPDRVLLCGGGSRNLYLKRRLQNHLQPVPVLTTDEVGLSADFKEAIAFAVLAYWRTLGIPGNLPQVTGAHAEVLLGDVYLPHPTPIASI